MPQGRKSTLPINRDLSSLSRYTTLAYILATVVLCCTIVFSYFTLKRIVIEQSALYALQTSTNQLWITIRDSSIYMSDLKTAKSQAMQESLLDKKITERLNASIAETKQLKSEISNRLLSLENYDYYSHFHDFFNALPNNIWAKLDQYIVRLEEISDDSQSNTRDSNLLWLPVEGTAAKNGALGKSYVAALNKLQATISERSQSLENTHFKLALLSILIVLLELVVIFLPLRHHLNKIKTNLTNAHEKLDRQANFDGQTGLRNTSGITKWLSGHAQSAHYDYLLMLSISNHDSVAQIIGPGNLEGFFRSLSERLDQLLPIDKMVYRAGDNQFGILLTEEAHLTLRKNHKRFQSQLTSKTIIGNSIVYPEIRLGSVSGLIDSNNLISKMADALIGSQQYNNTNTEIPHFEASMRTILEDENQVIEEMRTGILNKEFLPHYQLKVDSQTGKISGMEALCRWQMADGSLRQPYRFIPLAEKSGLIAEITWQLLETIAADHKYWHESGLLPGRIAFNAAETMLIENDFPSRLTAVLNKTGTNTCPLDLEITETVALASKSDVISNNLSFARRSGLQIALDDFGTGYASLSSIVSLDIDTIKVDKSFVSMMTTSDDAKNIVISIINLCKQLNKKCVVEGVETEFEYNFCKDLSCDEIQGYYFYKPAPFSDVLACLENEQIHRKAG